MVVLLYFCGTGLYVLCDTSFVSFTLVTRPCAWTCLWKWHQSKRFEWNFQSVVDYEPGENDATVSMSRYLSCVCYAVFLVFLWSPAWLHLVAYNLWIRSWHEQDIECTTWCLCRCIFVAFLFTCSVISARESGPVVTAAYACTRVQKIKSANIGP